MLTTYIFHRYEMDKYINRFILVRSGDYMLHELLRWIILTENSRKHCIYILFTDK